MVKLFYIIITFIITISNLYAVDISRGDTGDFLIAPLYEVNEDVCSDIRIFNTNEKSSILAKVVFREQINSEEIDLPIFLSPGDVWTASICQERKIVLLKSDDDSNHPLLKEDLIIGKDLNDHSLRAGNAKIDFRKGYIEVYSIAQYDEKLKKKVDKKLLVDRWDRLIEGDITDPKLSKSGVGNYLSGTVSFRTKNLTTTSIKMTAFTNTNEDLLYGEKIAYSEEASPNILLTKKVKKSILSLLQTKKISFTYENYGKGQYLSLAYPFGNVKAISFQGNNQCLNANLFPSGCKERQVRRYKVVVRDLNEYRNRVMFSPSPIYLTNKELSTISVEELINKTREPKKFVKGMIQISEIRNQTRIQLGKGKIASVIPLITTCSTMQNGKYKIILNTLNPSIR
jgi:hypothetical protein